MPAASGLNRALLAQFAFGAPQHSHTLPPHLQKLQINTHMKTFVTLKAAWAGLAAVALGLMMPCSAGAQTSLSGTLGADATLDITGSPYVVSADFDVPAGINLTIDPGVQIFIDGIFTEFRVYGNLDANGTLGAPIRIQSIEGSGAGSVLFLAGSTGELDHVTFDSLATGGSAFVDAALYLEEPIAISNCTFQNNNLADVRALASAVSGFAPNNSFENGPILLLPNSLSGTTTWPQASADPVTYRLLSDQTVAAGDSLTIEAGVGVELDGVFTDLSVDGHLHAVGSAGNRVRFLGTAPNGGGSVALRKGSSGAFDYARFEELGISGSSFFDCALYVDSADLQLARSIFTNNTVDIRSRADALSAASGNNQLDLVFLRNNSIAKNATLPNLTPTGTYYRTESDQTIPAGVVFNIEPDVTIELNGVFIDLLVDGALLANGMPSAPIRLIAGASGGGSLALRDGAQAEISYMAFDSLGNFGSSAYDCAVWVDDAQLTLSNCQFTDNDVEIRGRADRLKAFDGSNGITNNNNGLDRVVLFANSIDESVTWPSFTPSGAVVVLNGDQIVPAGETLTLTAPIDLHFESIFHDLIVDGGLLAEGTATDSIRFIGIGPDGGGSVSFRADSLTGVFRYAAFDKLGISGSSAWDCGLNLDGTQAILEHTRFRNCTVDIKGHGEAFVAFAQNNDVALIEVQTPDIDRDAHWVMTDTVATTYRLLGNTTAEAGTVLTIDPGVRVEITTAFNNLRIEGGLQAVGSVYDSILFVGTGASGGGSLALLDGSFNHDLAYCGFENLGSSPSSFFNCALQVSTAGNTDIFACRFADLGTAIKATDDADPNIEGCAFRNNAIGVDVRNGASAKISYSAFTGHTNLAVENNSSNPPLLACDNWWGGGQAFNPTNYPTGTGDPIGDNVQSNGGCLLPVDPHEACIPPQVTLDEVTGPTEVRFAWKRVPGAFGYRVEATKYDTLRGIFRSTVNRRTQSNGILPGDTIVWTVKAGCPFDTSIQSGVDTVIVPLLVRLNQNAAAELRVWPQPSSGVFHMTRPSAEGQSLGEAVLRIYDLKGRLVAPAIRFRAEERTRQIDLDRLPAGAYFYHLDSGDQADASGTLQLL